MLKGCVKEFQQCELEDIAEKYIEGTPQVDVVGVDKDTTNPAADSFQKGGKISAASNEDSSATEGSVRYDIRFLAVAPGSGDLLQLIINVEAQKSYYPGYPIVKRGIYYAARMIGAQKDVEFTDGRYGEIKKVYSIWICYDVPEKRKNTIACYELGERFLTDRPRGAEEPKRHYDLMAVLILGLGDPEQAEKHSVLRMLGIALSSTAAVETKKRVLSEDFGIRMSEAVERKVDNMCNLSYGIREEGERAGIKKGIEQGIEQGIVQGIEQGVRKGRLEGKKEVALNMKKKGYPDTAIADLLEVGLHLVQQWFAGQGTVK